jgi:hypothetical protein
MAKLPTRAKLPPVLVTAKCFACGDIPKWLAQDRPRTGDVTVCSACTAVNIMRANGRLENPTARELAAASKDQVLFRDTYRIASALYGAGGFRIGAA